MVLFNASFICISFLSYIGVIKRRDGFLGLYAGFAPRVMEMGAAHAATLAFNTYWPEDKTDKDGQQHSTRASWYS